MRSSICSPCGWEAATAGSNSYFPTLRPCSLPGLSRARTETQSRRGKQPTARPAMGAPRRVRLMGLPRVLWGSVPLFLLLLPAAEPICPEPCDCQQHQHLLCTNRGLRSVPKAAEPQDILTYSLGGNFIANISAFDFHRLAGLQRLDLQYNRIRSLHPKAFERLGRLEELYLGNNLLPALAPGTLSALAKLRILYVNANEIGRLSAASFSGLGRLPNLLYLSLRHPDIFGPLRSLHTLLLASNSLQQLTGGLFQHLPGLVKLSLSGNRLAHLAPDAFTGLGSLKDLRLEGNLLSHLPAALLEPLSSLEALDLSRNALTALHPATFGHLGRLRELSLRDNRVQPASGLEGWKCVSCAGQCEGCAVLSQTEREAIQRARVCFHTFL
uniref:TLR4 interactor with leucine rich repeats n=1 Tax=Otus sunia TaxID=257818 RepID=A0A8C8AWR8_9STRI